MGEPYPPPKDIHQILTGLQRYMLAKNPSTPMFLDKGETYFSEICGTYDTVYRDLHSKEIEEEICHRPVITPEEDKLWQSSVLSVDYPKACKGVSSFMVENVIAFVVGKSRKP